MAITVKVSIQLRRLTNGKSEIKAEGQTVAEVLADLSAKFPFLAEKLFTPDGTPQQFVNFYVNGEDVRYRLGLATPLTSADELLLLSAVSGG